MIVIGAFAGGMLIAPRLSSDPSRDPGDPGCKAYISTALPAYNRAVNAMDSKAHQAPLTADLTTAIDDLGQAAGKARNGSVKSALGGLRIRLTTVRADVRKGYIPPSVVPMLNNASHAADSAC